MGTTEQTNTTIGDNIDQEALVNSFFEGVTGPIDSGMREMVEEFCQDIIWRTSAIPPRKQALFADEIAKLLKDVPELMTLSELQEKLIAILDKVDEQVAEVREKVPDELYTKPAVRKKASSTKSKSKPAKVEALEMKELVQEEMPEPKVAQETELRGEDSQKTTAVILGKPIQGRKEKTELVESVQDDFWMTAGTEMVGEGDPSNADDILLSMFESDNAAFRKNGDVQPVNEAIRLQPTASRDKQSILVAEPQQSEDVKTIPAKAKSNPLQEDAFANVRKIREKFVGTPNPRQSGAVIRIGWAIAKGTITWESVNKCATYEDLLILSSKI